MYLTPFLDRVKELYPATTDDVNDWIFWLFWSGLYVTSADLTSLVAHSPYYLLLIMLTLEKYSHKWVRNRFNCNRENIIYFKTILE